MRAPLVLLTLVACGPAGGGDNPTDGTTDTTGTADPFARFINLDPSVTTTGDFSGFTPGTDWASTAWLEQSVDGTKVASADLEGVVLDFENDTPVEGATLNLWDSDLVSGTPDRVASSVLDGIVSTTASTCAPLTYKVSTDPVLAETKTTFEAHQIYPAVEGGTITGAEFTSVSTTTYQLIPTLLGVSIDPDKAIVAGTAFDVARLAELPSDDNTGKIEGAQVIVYDAEGNIPDSLAVNYFIEDFPDRDQLHTSADGLWVASNVPPGELRVELWGNLDGVLTLLGATVVHSEADSINISNIYAGYGEGVKFPSSCVTAP